MFCPCCGRQLPDRAAFCAGCGEKLIGEGKSPTAKRLAKPPEPPTKGKKNSRCWMIAAIVMVILTVAVLAVGAVWLLPRNDGQDASGEDQNAAAQLQSSATESYSPETSQTADRYSTEPVQTQPVTEPVTVPPTQPATTAPTEAPLPEMGPYLECFQKYEDYVLADSNTAYLSRRDIAGLSTAERQVAAQEIYARHGQTSTDPMLQAYFESRSWYSPEASAAELNSCEQANLKLLQVFAAQEDGTLYTSGNPYVSLQKDADGFIISGSSDRYLSAVDTEGKSLEWLQLARNEIFARRGYLFGDDELLTYFYTKNWYVPTTPGADFDSAVFTETERANADFIRAYEIRAKGVTFSVDNPFKAYYDPSRNYIFPGSSTTAITEGDIWGMGWQELSLGRNEILARCGYTFTDRDLLEYFLHYSWYKPSTPPGKQDLLALNEVEKQNGTYLRQWQDVAEKIPDLNSLDRTMNYTVECDLFSVTVPAYWRDCGEISVEKNRISFREKFSKDSYGGNLFTVTMFSSESEYVHHPNYQVILVEANGQGEQRHLVVTGPTDVQFCPVAAQLYQMMAQEKETVLGTIQIN